MAKHYLDNVAFTSKTQGVNESLAIRDVEARALIQTNTNAIAEVTAKEVLDRADIDKNEKDIADLNKAVVRIDQKDAQQDNRLDDIEAKNEEQDTRLTAAETEITSLDARMDSAEDSITRLDEHMTAVEAKNVEQDERLDRVEEKNTEQDNRITKNETDIAAIDVRVTTAETDITNIKQKDEEQDRHLTELDDKVAASTYEAGIGIYFGQGKVHTNINVEDEILDQINQNTIDIDILKKKKSGSLISTNGYSYSGVDEHGIPKIIIKDGFKYDRDIYVGYFQGGANEYPENIYPNSPNYGIYIEDGTDIDGNAIAELKVTPTFLTADPFKSPSDYVGLYNFVLTDDFMYDISTATKFDVIDPSKTTYEVHNLRLAVRGCLSYLNVTTDNITTGTDFVDQISKYVRTVNSRKEAGGIDGHVDVPLMVEYTLSADNPNKLSTSATIDLDSISGNITSGKVYIPIITAENPFILIDTFSVDGENVTHTYTKKSLSGGGGSVNAVATDLPDGTANLSFS